MLTLRRGRRRTRRALSALVAIPLLIAQCAPPPPPPPGSWQFLDTDGVRYTRWCRGAIRFEIDVTVPPTSDERGAILDALATASAATGIRFDFVGDRAGATPSPAADAVVGYRDFTGGTLGEGGGSYTASYEMVVGQAHVDVGLTPKIRRTALLHEIAHMLGLDHVGDPAQLMYPAIRIPPRQAYANGDLEGLRRVGTSVPCGGTRSLSRELRTVIRT